MALFEQSDRQYQKLLTQTKMLVFCFLPFKTNQVCFCFCHSQNPAASSQWKLTLLCLKLEQILTNLCFNLGLYNAQTVSACWPHTEPDTAIHKPCIIKQEHEPISARLALQCDTPLSVIGWNHVRSCSNIHCCFCC